MRDIGRNIKDLRIKNHLSQEELAARLFVTRQTISNYENGKSRPDIDSLEKIAEVLHTDVNTVLYGAVIPADRSVLRRKIIILGSAVAVMIISVFILKPWCDKLLYQKVIVEPGVFMKMYYIPLIVFLAGYWIMEVIAYFFKLQPYTIHHVGIWRDLLIGLLVICLIINLPEMLTLLFDRIFPSIYNSIGRLVNQPTYSRLMLVFAEINMRYSIIYAISGGLLCAFDLSQKNQK
jgi:transcriptional regulator with XRE-family HTH domain